MSPPAGEKVAREHESGGWSGNDDGPPQGQGQGRDEGMLRLPAGLALIHVGGHHRDRRDPHRLGRDGDHHDRHQQQRCFHRERESFHDDHHGRRRRRRQSRTAVLQYYLPSADDRLQHRRLLPGRPRPQGQE